MPRHGQDVDLIRRQLLHLGDENESGPGHLLRRAGQTERKVQNENQGYCSCTGFKTINERERRWVHSSEYLRRLDVVFQR